MAYGGLQDVSFLPLFGYFLFITKFFKPMKGNDSSAIKPSFLTVLKRDKSRIYDYFGSQ